MITREREVLRQLQQIVRRDIAAMRIRCHGDYHLGQVLYTGSDFVIVDFEGEPSPIDRRAATQGVAAARRRGHAPLVRLRLLLCVGTA